MNVGDLVRINDAADMLDIMADMYAHQLIIRSIRDSESGALCLCHDVTDNRRRWLNECWLLPWGGSMRRWNLLSDLINERDLRAVAEIGVGNGQTARYVLENCPNLKRYYAVDLWEPTPGHGEDFNHSDNLMKVTELAVEQPRLHGMVYDSELAATCFEDGELDLVFIDADHDYKAVADDIRAWYPKVKVGGWLCGHDISKPGVRKAVGEFEKGVSGMVNHKQDITWWHQKQDRKLRYIPNED